METVTPKVPESQVIEWMRELSPSSKRAVLQALIPDLDKWDTLVDYGGERIRKLCAERGIDWDLLTEEERQHLTDELLHEQ